MVGPHGCKTVEKEMRLRKVNKSWQQESESNEKLMSKVIWRFLIILFTELKSQEGLAYLVEGMSKI